MNDETMRKAFEKWASSNCYDLSEGYYNPFGHFTTQHAWESWQAAWSRAQASAPDGVDSGNLVSDPLYLALDALYERGWTDSEKHKHDPRGTNQWQAVLDLFRAYTRSNAKPGEAK